MVCRGWAVSITQVVLMASPLSTLYKAVRDRSSASFHPYLCVMGLVSSVLYAFLSLFGITALFALQGSEIGPDHLGQLKRSSVAASVKYPLVAPSASLLQVAACLKPQTLHCKDFWAGWKPKVTSRNFRNYPTSFVSPWVSWAVLQVDRFWLCKHSKLHASSWFAKGHLEIIELSDYGFGWLQIADDKFVAIPSLLGAAVSGISVLVCLCLPR